jgi:uncharacterized protein
VKQLTELAQPPAKRGSGTLVRRHFLMPDGVSLAATLYLPETTGQVPALLEALPYRKDDVLDHDDDYLRLRDEFGYAVCRLDLRGTGSSQGVAVDEYPESEVGDLGEVIAQLAAAEWCTGAVGMFGTSYSGFNSLQVAATRPPALKAIVPIYSSDDPYTDDVHYMGGSLRLLDLVDYPTYMAAINALPPVPAFAVGDWRSEWESRLATTEPWLLTWFEQQTYGPYWQSRAIKPDYARIDCPTMIVAGWADGYRNNTFRTFEALHTAGTTCRLIVGPWSHMSPNSSLPGPWIDLTREMVRWFDRWLKEDRNGIEHENPIEIFVRQSTPPGPLIQQVEGYWRSEQDWPTHKVVADIRPFGSGVIEYTVRPSVGTSAWISCAGSLPWGAPDDVRSDDEASLTWEWPVDSPLEILGHAVASFRVAADRPVAGVSVKLVDVFPDGRATLITRGYINLTHRGDVHEAPRALNPGTYYDVELNLEATSYELNAGHRLRLSIAGTDWPNVIAPPAPVTLSFDLTTAQLTVPIVPGTAPRSKSSLTSIARATEFDRGSAQWRIERDVLGGETSAIVDYGDTWVSATGIACADHYAGRVSVSDSFDQRVVATCSYEVAFDDVTVRTDSDFDLTVTESSFDLEVRVRAAADGELVSDRTWTRTIPRQLA